MTGYKDTPNYLLQIDNELKASTIEELKKHDGLEDADFKVHKKTSFYKNGRTTIYLKNYIKAEEFFRKHKKIGGHDLKMIKSNSLEPNETNTWVLILSGTTLDKSNAGMHEELKIIRETIEKSAEHYKYEFLSFNEKQGHGDWLSTIGFENLMTRKLFTLRNNFRVADRKVTMGTPRREGRYSYSIKTKTDLALLSQNLEHIDEHLDKNSGLTFRKHSNGLNELEVRTSYKIAFDENKMAKKLEFHTENETFYLEIERKSKKQVSKPTTKSDKNIPKKVEKKPMEKPSGISPTQRISGKPSFAEVTKGNKLSVRTEPVKVPETKKSQTHQKRNETETSTESNLLIQSLVKQNETLINQVNQLLDHLKKKDEELTKVLEQNNRILNLIVEKTHFPENLNNKRARDTTAPNYEFNLTNLSGTASNQKQPAPKGLDTPKQTKQAEKTALAIQAVQTNQTMQATQATQATPIDPQLPTMVVTQPQVLNGTQNENPTKVFNDGDVGMTD
ncbi:hypothetical protein CYY_009827 [Polysphondylium violaceum]|uniref:Uncharacterized protein n=1 Tax=Polysphondylium violaceum TaxID=133409 RepID=A0A8J4V074_9MYCE|nr:hypothetical protein CYY_009827 [Polysphondylium violaceum]